MDWRPELEALVVTLLDGLPPIVVEPTAAAIWCRRCPPHGGLLDATRVGARCRPAALPLATGAYASLLLSFVGVNVPPTDRRALLHELARALAPGGALLVVDHNRPRRLVAALGALVGRPHPPGRSPAERWRRLAHPTAREIQAVGFAVERLRLAAGERVQLVVARRR